MKTVIEKIILNYFGTFINGIHKDKLSIDLFGGNFQLENISLNHQYFESLNTPFRLTYSSIGKLNLQAPISKLASAPVECVLDNIYAVFEFKDDAPEKEQLSGIQLFQLRKQQIENHIRDMFDNYLKRLREKEDKKEDGMMAKLGKKIIDNLQLRIVNVHVRFEERSRGDTEGHKYAWGLTLEQISFFTTDNDWKPAFVDRSAESHKHEKLFKKMSLKNLNLYWQSEGEGKPIFVTELQSEVQKKKTMLEMIKEDKDSIISLTSEFKLVINPPEKLQVPLYELSVELAPIKFELERVQVSEMIEFAQKNMVKSEIILKKLSLKKKKSSQVITPEERKKFQGNFLDYVQVCIDKIQNSQVANKNEEIQEDDFEMNAILKTIFAKVEQEEILGWALKPIRGRVRQARERQLKKKKKGWFGGQYQLNEEETKALENFVEEVADIEQQSRPADSLFFSLDVLIHGGIFSFVDHRDCPEEERIVFKIGAIAAKICKSQNDSLLILQLDVKQIALDLYLPKYGSLEEKLQLNVLSNDHRELEKAQQKFISVKFIKRVLLQQEGRPTIRTDIEGQMKKIIFTYKKLYLKKFKAFFTFKNVREDMRNQTIKKWEQMKEKQGQQEEGQGLTQDDPEVLKLLNIQVKVISPLFICPLADSDCWCLSLGDLTIFSSRDQDKQVYPMKIKEAYFRYYADIQDCQSISPSNNNPKRVFSLINDMNFQLTHHKYHHKKVAHTEINLPTFSVNFTEEQYKNLLSLRDIFKMDEEESNFLQTLKKQRLEVENKMRFCGPLQKKNDELEKWRPFFGILSGDCIHLYGSQKELKCVEKVSLKHSRLETSSDGQVLSLINQDGEIYITGTELENNTEQWKINLQKQLKEFVSVYDLVEEDLEGGLDDSPRKRKETQRSVIDPSQSKKSLRVNINRISFNYQDQRTLDSIMNFQVNGLVIEQSDYKKISSRKILIQQLLITDYIYKYAAAHGQQSPLQTLLRTGDIEVNIQRDKNQASRKNHIKMKVPTVDINWKPDVLIILLQLLYRHFAKEQKLRVDDGQAKTREQLMAEVRADRKFQFLTREYERGGQGRRVKEKRFQYAQKNKHMKQLLTFSCQIGQMQIVMLHRQSHLTMFKLLTQNIQNQFILGENEKFVSGTIDLMELYDMTEYPKDDYKADVGRECPHPYKIISPKMQVEEGGKQGNNNKQGKPLIQYKWSSYEPFVLPNSERVNSFLHAVINPMTCEYFQQVTFRAIDYILIQVILLLNQPEMLIANQNLLEQLRKSSLDGGNIEQAQESNIVKVLFSEYEEIIKRIIDPYFMDMYIRCASPSVIVKPQKDSQMYYRADFANIEFSNRETQSGRRFTAIKGTNLQEVLSYVYEEEYLIYGHDCRFYSISEERDRNDKNKGRQELVFAPFGMEVVLNKLMLEDQLNILYPELDNYDRSFYTIHTICELAAENFTRHQYLLLNKLTNFNMIFDDNKDELFIHNFKITKLLSPKPIYYELNLNRIYLAGKEGGYQEQEEQKQNTQGATLDLFQVTMSGCKMVYQRNTDLNSSFKIVVGRTEVYGYEYPTAPSSVPNEQLKDFFQAHQKPKKTHLLDIKSQHKEDQAMELMIRMRTTGQKIIEMNLEEIQANLQLHLLQMIFQWSLLEDWVFPTVSIYANDITFHITIHRMCAWLQQSKSSGSIHASQQKSQKKIEKRADKMSQEEGPVRAFRLLGIFCYKFHRKAFFSQQHIERQFKEGEITTNEINNLPEISYMTILLNTEVENCLRAPASNTVLMKRQVIQKITLNMIQKKHYKVASESDFRIKPMCQRKLNLDRGLFKVSFTDIILIDKILLSIGHDRRYVSYVKNLIESQINKEKLLISRQGSQKDTIIQNETQTLKMIQQERPRSGEIQVAKHGENFDKNQNFPTINKQGETEISSLDNFDIDIESISLYLINNCRQSFIPVFKLQINNASLSKVNTFKKNLLKGNLDITANYFNAAIFKWEPVLEKVDVIFHQLVYRGPPEEEVEEYFLGKQEMKEKQERRQIRKRSAEEEDNLDSPKKKWSENKFSSLETNQPVLINVSKELMLSLKEMQTEWDKNKDRKIERQSYENSQQWGTGAHSAALQTGEESIVEIFVSQYVIRNETGYPLEIYSHGDKKLRQRIPHMRQVNYSNDLQSLDSEGGKEQILVGFSIVNHHKYKFKRVTHIPLDLNKGFELQPQIVGLGFQESYKKLPRNSHLQLIPEIKDSKRYLTIRSTKSIESYLDNKFERTVLPFDYEEKVKLYQEPHNGLEVSLYKEVDNPKQKCRYVGHNGRLKILPKFLVYNYTPIPLKACSHYLMPGEFVGISESLTIQNMKWRDCKGVKVDYNQKLKEYYLYCEGYVIDYAGLYFEFNSGYDAKAFSHEFIEKGYKFSIYLLTDGEAKFKVRLKKNYRSSGSLKCSEVIKPAVGNDIFHLHDPHGAHCDFQTYGYLSSYSGKEHSQYRSFKKVIQITPLYVLSNTTKYKLKVCQIGSCQSMALQPGERVPFFWESRTKPKQIKIAAVYGDQMWGYSGPLQIQQNTNSFVVRKTAEISDYKILRTQIETTNTITFVHIVQPSPKNGTSIILSNQVHGISFRFYQASIFDKDHQMMDPTQYVFTIGSYEEVPFGFQLPLEPRQLTMEAVFDPAQTKYQGCYCKPVILEDVQTNLFEKHYSIYNKSNKRVKKLLLKLSFERNVKKLQILERVQKNIALNKGEFICKIPRIGLSLIGYQEKVRKEVIAVFLEGIQFQTATSEEITEYCLVLRGMKIDNCLKIAPVFPTILQSLITPQATFFVNFVLAKDNYNSQLIHYFGLSINKFVLTVSSEQIQCIQENFNQITEAFNKGSHDESQMRKYQLFTANDVQPQNLYFVEAEIHPLKTNVTFKHVNDWGGKILKTFAGIDDCNISVDGKKIRHFSSKNIGEFGKHLMKHYQEGVSKMLIPMIGNLSILGSPISLAQRIGSGFRDLVELPSEGFNVSPLEGGKGLAKGAGSLVKNTFEGALNSVESVTGSVGNGLSTLVFDESFNRERQRIRNQKSQHVGQGLSNGLKSIANGVGKGITGLVTSPVQGAQQSGIGGFFLGGIKGITGLVIKPVSGIFDATTKTFQGIKNTPSYISKSDSEKSNFLKRARNPRIFYGIDRQFKGYDQDLSMCAKLLVDTDKDKYENLSWYGLYHLISVKEDKKPLIFLTYEYFVIYNYARAEVMQAYRSQDIYEAKTESNNHVKVLMYDRKRKKMGHIDLKLKYAMAKKLTSDLTTISHLYRPIYGFDYELFMGKKDF